MDPRSRISALLVCSMLATVSISSAAGCDLNREERERVSREMEQTSTSLARLEAQKREAQSRIEEHLRAVGDLRREQESGQARKTKLNDELIAYVLDHKAASAALLATGGGAASVLSDNMDEDARKVLMVVGLVGVAYCIDEAAECAEVASRVAAAGARIKAADEELASTRTRIASAQGEGGRLHEALTSLDSQITTLTARAGSLRRQYETLK